MKYALTILLALLPMHPDRSCPKWQSMNECHAALIEWHKEWMVLRTGPTGEYLIAPLQNSWMPSAPIMRVDFSRIKSERFMDRDYDNKLTLRDWAMRMSYAWE